MWPAPRILKRWRRDDNKLLKTLQSGVSAIRQPASAGAGKHYPAASAGKYYPASSAGKHSGASAEKHYPASRAGKHIPCGKRNKLPVASGRQAQKNMCGVTCAHGNLSDSLFLLCPPCRWGRPFSPQWQGRQRRESFKSVLCTRQVQPRKHVTGNVVG